MVNAFIFLCLRHKKVPKCVAKYVMLFVDIDIKGRFGYEVGYDTPEVCFDAAIKHGNITLLFDACSKIKTINAYRSESLGHFGTAHCIKNFINKINIRELVISMCIMRMDVLAELIYDGYIDKENIMLLRAYADCSSCHVLDSDWPWETMRLCLLIEFDRNEQNPALFHELAKKTDIDDMFDMFLMLGYNYFFHYINTPKLLQNFLRIPFQYSHGVRLFLNLLQKRIHLWEWIKPFDQPNDHYRDILRDLKKCLMPKTALMWVERSIGDGSIYWVLKKLIEDRLKF